jgi:hypothetical protein
MSNSISCCAFCVNCALRSCPPSLLSLGFAFTVSAFIAVAVWVAATFAVLMSMDALECFLHALRLHWVESQNKHYSADGSDEEHRHNKLRLVELVKV